MNVTQPDGHLAPDQTLAKWDELHGHPGVTDAVGRLREQFPDMGITAEVLHGVVADGVSIEINGYFGVNFEVKAETAEAEADLALAEMDRVRAGRDDSHFWPPRLND